MATEFPNSGKLSHNKYKEQGDKKPDMNGEITMTRTALKGLLEEHDGDDIIIKLSAWQMSGQFGPWMRLAWNSYKKPEGQNPYVPPKVQTPPPPPVSSEDIPFN